MRSHVALTVGQGDASYGRRYAAQPAPRHLRRAALLLALAALAALALSGCATNTTPSGFTPGFQVAAAAAQANAPLAVANAPVASTAAVLGQPLAFAGAVNALPAGGGRTGLWQVGDQSVSVGPSTQIDERNGKLRTGARIAVEGWQGASGPLDAGWIHVLGNRAMPASDITASVALTVPTATATPVIKGSPSRWITDTIHPVEYRGLVQMLPSGTMTGTMTGTWTIGGHLVNIGPGTDLKLQLGALKAGAYVQVIGWLQPDGSIDATKILVKKLNPGQAKGHPPTGGITGTLPLTGTLPGDGDELDLEEPGGQGDGNPNWDIRLHGPVAGSVITTTSGLTYTLTVNGQHVVVDAATWLKARRQPAEGDWLQVKGFLQPDGTILATSIQWVHRVPAQPGKSGENGNGKAKGGAAPAATPVPPAGQSMSPGASNHGGGQGSNHRPPANPGQGNGNGNGKANGNGNGKK